ncbi:uncharacterized protein LOC117190182 [Drosophila miranda]|uniref:uncharacterized protein LOC117190182 n=1 Tax=Drosophila miranda TaxID=7229 RepID=UPI00143F8249|nr:uncharacterized protein LOC117190182 [Drosophila miranda]XP_033251136.1 uncharacterized protein LOC117190182 [Drosophila miranda]XP_033251137.1 uncharacterized protein LOC117190182 [Drosophila miranda]
MKLSTIPRLELQAAVLGTRLRKCILEGHDVNPKCVHMWSDSKTVLAWIKSDHRKYKPYVEHRIDEILEATRLEDWHWVPTKDNPADFGTKLRSGTRETSWLRGPQFLQEDASQWNLGTSDVGDTELELRSKFTLSINEMSSDGSVNIVFRELLERFSSFTRLMRVVAWVYRMCYRKIKRKVYLDVAEIEEAILIVIRNVQDVAFHDKRVALLTGQSIEKNSKLWKFSPIIDGRGVIRMNGRINNACSVGEETRRPILMPQGHHVTKLIVRHYHELWKHQNENTIIAEIRRKYYIPHCRQEVRRAARNCMTCKIQRASPKMPLMGQLPKDRLYIVNSRPLTHIALDNPTDDPITPNHFLLGSPNSSQTPHPQEEMYQPTRKEWRIAQQISHSFWNKWLNEYLPDLCRRTKWHHPVPPLAEMDIVLICDKNLHRSQWKKGVILAVTPGRDGQVRSATVKTTAGVLHRPTCKLAKLDIL